MSSIKPPSAGVNTYQGFNLPLGLLALAHWLVAMASVIGVLALSVLMFSGALDAQFRLISIGSLLVSYPIYSALNVYSFESSRASLATKITSAWFSTGAVLLLVYFASGTSLMYGEQILLSWYVLSWLTQIVVALVFKEVVKGFAARRAVTQNAIVVGAGSWAVSIAQQVAESQQWELLGVLDQGTHSGGGGMTPSLGNSIDNVAVISDLSDLRKTVEERDVRRIFIALPSDDPELVQKLYVSLLDTLADVVWVVRPSNMVLFNPNVDTFEGARAIYLNASPLTSYPSAVFVKHLLDRSLAAMMLLTFSPLFVGLALAVKLSSKGPVFFVQARHGLNAKPFNMWKFRSMYLHEADEVVQATEGDDRVTPVGRFLRKTSMDELPQLLNVIAGEMSLVGPRPHAIQHNDFYAEKLKAYMARHRVKPGLTGLAQINGFRGETDTLDKMEGRLQYDLAYINSWSLRLDFEILLKTPKSILKHKAY